MAVQTKDQLKTLSNTTFKDNNNGEIEPVAHRAWNVNLIDSMATVEQGAKADTAIQTATIGGATVPKSGTVLQIPERATVAQGAKADTAVQSATVGGVAVPKSGTTLVFPTFGQDLVTYVIDTQAKFIAWVNNTAGNDYSVVYIKKGTYTATKGVDLVATKTKRIYGEPGNIIQITGAAYGLQYLTGYQNSAVFDSEISINGLHIEGFNMTGAIIKGCSNVSNCFVQTDGANGNKCYEECFNLSGCYACCTSGTDGTGFNKCEGLSACYTNTCLTGFTECNNLTNCVAQYVQTAYEVCLYLSNCRAQDTSYGFDSCEWLTNCYSYTSKMSGFMYCKQLTSCRSVASFESAFIYCSYLTTCHGESQHYGFQNCSQMTLNFAVGKTGKYTGCQVGGTNAANTSAGGFNG